MSMAMMARIQALEERFSSATQAAVNPVAYVGTPPDDVRIKELESRVRDLENKYRMLQARLSRKEQ